MSASPPSHVDGDDPVSTSSEAIDNPGDGRGGDEGMVDSSEDVTSSTSSVVLNVGGGNEEDEISSSADVGSAGPVTGTFAQPMLPPPLSSTSKTPSPSSSSSDKKVSFRPPGVSSSERPSSSSSSTSSKSKEKLAKEKQEKYNAILSTLKYHPPKQGSPKADPRYNLEVLKNGSIVDSVKFLSADNKGYYIVGRVPGCDIVAENPTVSRLHAVLQFVTCPKKSKSSSDADGADADSETNVSSGGDLEEPQETGLYLFDLKSTHGTFLNKHQVFPHKFYRVHVGHVIKFGSSQRMYIVNGPTEDEEEESDKTVTELQNERLQKDLERKRYEEEEQLKRTPDSNLSNHNVEVDGINWGMAEDADEESDLRVNPFAMDYEANELTLDNPKKSLRSWFEREGEDLEFEIKEKGSGQYVCRIALPLDGPTDAPVYAESEIKAKKKEAANDAALKACQILDSHGLLRSSNQESRKRKEKRYEDEDYYSSDEDTFLDRTGSAEKKRQKRMRLTGKTEEKVETYDSLSAKYSQLEAEISDLNSKIEKSQQMKARADEGEMDIDDYMKLLKTDVFDAKKLRFRLKEANEEMKRTKKLMEIAKPTELPSYLSQKAQTASKSEITSTATSSSIELEPTAVDQVDKTSNSSAVGSDSVSDKQEPTQSEQEQAPASSLRRPVVGPMKPPTSSSSLKGNLNTKQKLFGLILPANLKAALRQPDVSIQQASVDELEKEDEEENESSSGEEEDLHKNDIEEELEEPDQGPEFVAQSKKKKRQRYRNKQKSKGQSSASYGADDPNYSVWVPPKNQTGDGKTSLNEKLGY